MTIICLPIYNSQVQNYQNCIGYYNSSNCNPSQLALAIGVISCIFFIPSFLYICYRRYPFVYDYFTLEERTKEFQKKEVKKLNNYIVKEFTKLLINSIEKLNSLENVLVRINSIILFDEISENNVKTEYIRGLGLNVELRENSKTDQKKFLNIETVLKNINQQVMDNDKNLKNVSTDLSLKQKEYIEDIKNKIETNKNSIKGHFEKIGKQNEETKDFLKEEIKTKSEDVVTKIGEIKTKEIETDLINSGDQKHERG